MTDVSSRSLADFKRFLLRPAVSSENLRNEIVTENGKGPEKHHQAYRTRQIKKVPDEPEPVHG